MLLSILDETTFMAGGKTYKVGEELNISEMTAPIVFTWGQTTVEQLNDHLKTIAAALRNTRSNLTNRLHVVDEAFDNTAEELAIAYENLERDWLYYSDVFYKAIQAHVGGMLPLLRNPETGVITVRQKQPQETLNYLREVCSQRVMFHNYEGIRHIALGMVNGELDLVSIESGRHISTRVPIVSADCLGDPETPAKPMIDQLQNAVVSTYDKVTRYGPVAGIMWSHYLTNGHIINYFLNASALLQSGQFDPKLAFTTAMARCKDELPKPFAIGFFIYGNMPIVDEKARGVLISTLHGDKANYRILVVDQSQKLTLIKDGNETTMTVAHDGEGAKLDPAIVELAQSIMGVDDQPEEKPEETTKEN